MASLGIGVYGYLKVRNSAQTIDIIRRTPAIDDLLRRNGYDPDSINRADTPLVGAENYATIRVVLRHRNVDGSVYSNAGTTPLQAGKTILYDLLLAEPNAALSATPDYDWVEGAVFPNIIRGRLSTPVVFPQYLPPGVSAGSSSLVSFSGPVSNPFFRVGALNGQQLQESMLGDLQAAAGNLLEPSGQDNPHPRNLAKSGAVLSDGQRSRVQAAAPVRESSIRSKAQMAAAMPATSGTETTDPTDPNPTGNGNDSPDKTSFEATTPLGFDYPPRYLHWANLNVRTLRELRQSAANPYRPIMDGYAGRPSPDVTEDTLYVAELVDARCRLGFNFDPAVGYRNIVAYSEADGKIQSDDANTENIYGGYTQSAFNMLAEVPIQFEASTVRETVICRRAMSVLGPAPAADRSPTLDGNVVIPSTIATAPTYVQRPFGMYDLLQVFANCLEALVGDTIYLDTTLLRSSLETDSEPQAIPLLDDGDIINLDFAGMTIGQALDFFAKRCGGCWLWERSSNALIFSFVDGPMDPAWIESEANNDMGVAARAAIADPASWFDSMRKFRTLGHFNTINDLVPYKVTVNHEARYCARYGPSNLTAEADQARVFWEDFEDQREPQDEETRGKFYTLLHYVDCRTGETLDGAVSTAFITGLGSRPAAINQENWVDLSSTDSVYITVQDHIPALVGANWPQEEAPPQIPGVLETEDSWLHRKKRLGLGTTRMQMSNESSKKRVPWNYSQRTLRTAFSRTLLNGGLAQSTYNLGKESDSADWGTTLAGTYDDGNLNIFDTSLKRRREIYWSRMQMLRRVVDGDASFVRLPATTLAFSPSGPIGGTIFEGFITPSVGLQNESIVFGTSEHVGVRYRIWGSRFDQRIMPHGAKLESVGTAGSALVPTSAAPTVRVKQKNPGTILRSFVCRFDWYKEISTKNAEQFKAANTTLTQPHPFIWLYKFVEVVPDNNPETMLFAQNDYLGWQTNAIGFALNLCEMNYRDEVKSETSSKVYAPTSAWDGSSFSWNNGPDQTAPIVTPTAPGGYCICYEVANRMGFSSYYILAPNGIDVSCAPRQASLVPPDSPFLYMGGSGVGKQQTDQTVSDAILQA